MCYALGGIHYSICICKVTLSRNLRHFESVVAYQHQSNKFHDDVCGPVFHCNPLQPTAGAFESVSNFGMFWHLPLLMFVEISCPNY